MKPTGCLRQLLVRVRCLSFVVLAKVTTTIKYEAHNKLAYALFSGSGPR